MDRMTGYEPVDPGSSPGESVTKGKLNMFTVGNDCARLVAIKALLQKNLQWRLFHCLESIVVGSCCQHMRGDSKRISNCKLQFSKYN